MSDNQIIAASLKVDADEAVKNVLRLKGEVANLEKEFKNAEAGSDAQIKALKKLKAAQDELSTASKALGGNFKNIKSDLASLPGPASQLTGSLGGVNQAFNLLKANPIIGVFALLAGIVLALFEKFRKMEGVSDSLGKAFASLSAIFNIFANKVLTPLIEGFTKFIDLAVKAATFIADIFSPGLGKAAERSGELADALDDLNDSEADSAIARAESNRKLQEARDLANDANVPIRDRIKALKEAAKIEKEEFDKSIAIATSRAKIMLEQIAIELGARSELIAAIRNGSIEQLKAARNEIMAMQNVDKEKLKAIDALIIQAEDQGAERARINKKTEGQITTLEKEEESKRKEARQKAAADRKAEQQKLNEFNNKLRQLQQDNELSLIKDGYQKELKQLEIKLQNEKNANAQAVKDGRLTKQQALLLDIELQKQADLKKAEFTEKHNKELADKEIEYQAKLSKLKQEILLGGIVDSRKLEAEQAKVNYQNELAEAAKQYKDQQDKLAEVKALIDEKYRQEEKKRKDKNDEEDKKAAIEKAKKGLDDNIKKEDKVINDPNSELQAKIDAANLEQSLIQKAFDDKVITEEEYTAKVEDLAGKRMKIAELETEHKKAQTEAIAGTLTALADLVGKQTVAGKALGIATALINTYQGATEAIKQKSVLPSPFDVVAKVANVATVIATGLKTVKAITAVQVPGGGGGGTTANAPNIAPAAPVAPTQTSTKLDADSINGIGNAAQGGVNKAPLRAYVVGSDIEKDANRDERLRRASVLGGG